MMTEGQSSLLCAAAPVPVVPVTVTTTTGTEEEEEKKQDDNNDDDNDNVDDVERARVLLLEQADQTIARRIQLKKQQEADSKVNVLLPYLSSHLSLSSSPTNEDEDDLNNNTFKDFNFKDALLMDGYVVLPKVLTTQECDQMMELMTDYVQVVTKAEQAEDKHENGNVDVAPTPNNSNHTSPNTTVTGNNVKIESGDAGYVLGPLRELLAQRVFESMYHTDQLHSSKEGFTLASASTLGGSNGHECEASNTNSNTDSPNSNNNTHIMVVDQDVEDVGLHNIQSATCLSSNSNTDTGSAFSYVVYPGSHKVHPQLKLELESLDTNDDTATTTLANANAMDVLTTEGYDQPRDISIGCQPGDVIVWRSDLVVVQQTQSSSPSSCSSSWGYVSMIPAALTPKSCLKHKLEGYKLGRTTAGHCLKKDHPWTEPLGEPWLPLPVIAGKTRLPRNKQKQKGSYGRHKNNNMNIQHNGNDGSTTTATSTSSSSHPAQKDIPRRGNMLYHHYGPPKVNWRLAQLYGLVPYHNINVGDNDNEGNSKGELEGELDPRRLEAIRVATIRGVRFTNHDVLNPAVRQALEMTPITVGEDDEDEDDTNITSNNSKLLLDAESRQHLCGSSSPSTANTKTLLTKAKVSIVDPDQPPLMGQDKWLGGMPSPDGQYVYGVPGTAKQVLQIDTTTNKIELIGPKYDGEFKWLRGLEIDPQVFEKYFPDHAHKYPKGSCLALPSNASTVLEINPDTQKVMTFGGPFEGTWMWHGGCLSCGNQSQSIQGNGWVYAIPANASRVLRINPATHICDYIGPDFGDLKQKWYGGLCSSANGCIYGIPQNAAGILKITPHASGNAADDLVELFGQDLFPAELKEGDWKWHGGTLDLTGTIIYGYPNNADSVLKIDTNHNKDAISFLRGNNRADGTPILQSGHHRVPQDQKYKYLGGAISTIDRCLYLFPSEAERVLRICCATDEMTLVGPKLVEGGNKYQNGFCGSDGAVYAIPQHSKGILRIEPRVDAENGSNGNGSGNKSAEPRVEILSCGPTILNTKDKFEGGVMGPKDGCIYCIPLRAKRVVKVTPASMILR